ncbi:MAG: porphobilinogen synthase [Candidatus Dormibacteraeota bacterium]|uniref:Delta-aminolevulinic acid dehydratase n=1 Tax=Candidatus Aeolococcus gillhamiae TaxID=3127015 RepID=A0A934K459_9BACT|nr:porphobilinogen synthase [Candidatus Dormibacteraeota bacterium]
MAFPSDRTRRLRRTAGLRALARETSLTPGDLIQPAFVREGITAPVPIASMVHQQQETVESLTDAVDDAIDSGCAAVILFGLPEEKDASGSQAWDEDGIVQRALRSLRRNCGNECVLIADCCLDEYTDHGHCGVLRDDGSVDNDATIEVYGRIAVSQAAAGADIIAPSGMMDGQVAAIRRALDEGGFHDTAILAYSAKYASVMYGPFRDAADCAPQFGDRRSYQMDVANQREGVHRARLDVAEGADMVMVKPALTALDVVTRVRDAVDVPVGAFCVSGEHAMLHAAAAENAFEERAAVLEALTAIRRAGADLVITYDARRAARWLLEDLNRV